MHLDPVSGHPINSAFHPMATDIKCVDITKDCMRDPVNPNFLDEIWNKAAINNTKLYRRVFRCMPDSEVSTWTEYREYTEYSERFRASMEGKNTGEESEMKRETNLQHTSTAAGAGVSAPGPEAIVQAAKQGVEKIPEKLAEKLPLSDQNQDKVIVPGAGETELDEKVALQQENQGSNPRGPANLNTAVKAVAENRVEAPSPVYPPGDTAFPALETTPTKPLDRQAAKNTERKTTFSGLEKPPSKEGKDFSAPPPGQNGSIKRRRRGTTKGSRRTFSIEDMPSRADAEELLKMVQGNLVQFPYDWLLTEDQNGNWGFQVDGVAPLAI